MARTSAVSDEQLAKVREMRAQGMAQRAIAKEMGISQTTVRLWLMSEESYSAIKAENRAYKAMVRAKELAAADPPDFPTASGKVLPTDGDMRKLRLIHAAMHRGAPPSLIDRRMHWKPGETLRQLEGERLIRETRGARV